MNATDLYLANLGDLARWSPVVMPGIDEPAVWGVDIGVDPIRTKATEYIPQIFQPLLATLPGDVRTGVASAVTDTMGSILNAGGMAGAAAAVAGISQALATVMPLMDNMFGAMEEWAGYIAGKMKDNDTARAKRRTEYFMAISTMPPSRWVRAPWADWQYSRDIGLNRTRHPLIYPPSPGELTWASNRDFFAPLGMGPAAREPSSGCSGGQSNFSGGTGNCEGWFRTYPLLFPCWHNRAFGWTKANKGMERAGDKASGPASIMLGLQGALLSQPIPNLTADGRVVLKLWKHFREFFFHAMTRENAWDQRGAVDHAHGGVTVEIDSKFNPDVGLPSSDHKRNRFYWTPSGLIAAYVNAEGSLTADDLGNVGPLIYSQGEYNQSGGNFISLANFNAVNTACASFFSYRAALLRRQSFMVSIVDDYADLLQKIPTLQYSGDLVDEYPIADPRLRDAIVEAAKETKGQAAAAGGLDAPAGPGFAAGVGFDPGDIPTPPRLPGAPQMGSELGDLAARAPVEKKRSWVVPAAIAGGVAVAGAVAGGIYLARK